MKILIIGNGFLGSEIASRLESEGHEILIFARKLNPRIKCYQILGDIFDFDGFIRVFSWKPQVVIHTAWITTPGIYRNDFSNHQYSQFTVDLAKFVVDFELEHLVILGTCAEYGFQNKPCRAGYTDLAPVSLYARQKVAAHQQVKKLLHNSNVRLTWARVFYPFGPNQDQRRLIPFLIESLKYRRPIVLDDISSVYDWITSRDVASAISWCLNIELPQEIDIGTSSGFTNLELLIALEQLLLIDFDQPSKKLHKPGLGELFVVDKRSDLLFSGWVPKDTLIPGLEWTLSR